MLQDISVIGHKNPDTDCTLSAIIMAEYLKFKGYSPIAYTLGELNKETLYILEKYNISQPQIISSLEPSIPVCLVDHNEVTQSADNFKNLQITHIIDHHKIDFSSQNPLFMRIEPLCSTASVLYKMYLEAGFEISTQTATMMLACIISDSLLWKSPTTTLEDQDIAQKLQKISGISDLQAFAMTMFEAKSDLGDLTAEEIIMSDYKIFEVGTKKFGVGTVETTSPNNILARTSEILTGLQNIKNTQNLDFIMVSVVDILNEKNTTLTLDGDDTTILETVFLCKVIANIADLGARLSRKKQIIPELTEYFTGK